MKQLKYTISLFIITAFSNTAFAQESCSTLFQEGLQLEEKYETCLSTESEENSCQFVLDELIKQCKVYNSQCSQQISCEASE